MMMGRRTSENVTNDFKGKTSNLFFVSLSKWNIASVFAWKRAEWVWGNFCELDNQAKFSKDV